MLAHMHALVFLGAGSVLVGLVMVMLRHPVSTVFCRLGKFVFFIFRPIKPINDLVNFVYDEKKAPKIFILLGLVFLMQGVVVLLLAYYLSGDL